MKRENESFGTIRYVSPLMRDPLTIPLPILHIQEAHLPVLPPLLVHGAQGREREKE